MESWRILSQAAPPQFLCPEGSRWVLQHSTEMVVLLVLTAVSTLLGFLLSLSSIWVWSAVAQDQFQALWHRISSRHWWKLEESSPRLLLHSCVLRALGWSLVAEVVFLPVLTVMSELLVDALPAVLHMLIGLGDYLQHKGVNNKKQLLSKISSSRKFFWNITTDLKYSSTILTSRTANWFGNP